MRSKENAVRVGFVVFLVVLLVFLATRVDYSQSASWSGIVSKAKQLGYSLSAPAVATITPKAIPVSIPKPYVYHEPTEAQKNYVISLGSILSQQNGEEILELKSSLNKTNLKQVLKSSWDISDRKSAVYVLDWLRYKGHSDELNAMFDLFKQNNTRTEKDFIALKKDVLTEVGDDATIAKRASFVLDFAWEHRNDLREKSLYAWDYGRLVNVTRWCFTMGWITEEEAWTYLVPAAQILQTKYDSWADYGENYILGRGFWLADMNGTKTQKEILKFLLGRSPQTTWTAYEWKLSLD